MSLSAAKLEAFTRNLLDVVAACNAPDSMGDVAHGLVMALRAVGLPVDRLQLPLSFVFGLKHPVFAGIILTWTHEDGSSAWLRSRENSDLTAARELLEKSPFGPLLKKGNEIIKHRAGTPEWDQYPLLRDLASKGYVEYIALATPLPDGARQVISIATRSDDGFTPETAGTLRRLAPTMALALYSIYQASSAHQIARTYIGHRTGLKVLEGAIGRGDWESMTVAIAFVDVRNYTALSRELGPERLLPLLNQVFDALNQAIVPIGGEILKFIGDAALIAFPSEGELSPPCVDIVAHLLDAVEAIEAYTATQGNPLRIGVGLHVGEVVYGNVGSTDRLDFTVMGDAVNLASRLEPLTKHYELPIIVSDRFAQQCRDACTTPVRASELLGTTLCPLGPVHLKGIEEPVEIWGVEPRPALASGAVKDLS